MDRLAAMATYVKVVDLGSLSAGARSLNMGLTSVARQVSMLEERLGVRLLVRTTRRLALTEEGKSYYDCAKRILSDVEEAELILMRGSVEPTGRLAVAAPVVSGRLVLASLIPKFLAAYPRVSVDLTLADRAFNVVDEGFDVVIHVGADKLEDSSLIARKLGTIRRMVCGTPDYLAQRGVPRTPEDLRVHDCLLLTLLNPRAQWTFRTPEGELVVPISGRFRSNNPDIVLRAALSGAGLALLPWTLARDYVLSGELNVVLEDVEVPPVSLHVLFPHARLLSPKVRAFTDMLSEAFAQLLQDLIPARSALLR
jgi:DNA-binding transcriptional LysR family regulator